MKFVNFQNINRISDFQQPIDPEVTQSFEDALSSSSFYESVDRSPLEGLLVDARVVEIHDDTLILDVGGKSEGSVSKASVEEFFNKNILVGDKVPVYLERYEDLQGRSLVSFENAQKEILWDAVEKKIADNEPLTVKVLESVRGGFRCAIRNIKAFIPFSQSDVYNAQQSKELIGSEQTVYVLSASRQKNNLVVSRKKYLEEKAEDIHTKAIASLSEGDLVEGTVKKIVEYGAFINLGAIDGLVHISDLEWTSSSSVSDVLKTGEKRVFRILRINPEMKRISLGLRQVTKNPWDDVNTNYKIGTEFTGKIRKIEHYGFFISAPDGVEGLLSFQDNPSVDPSVKKVSDPIDVKVVSIDYDKRRLNLSIK